MPENSPDPPKQENTQDIKDIERYERLQDASEKQLKRIVDAYETHASLIKIVVVCATILVSGILGLWEYSFYHSLGEMRDDLKAREDGMEHIIASEESLMSNRVDLTIASLTNRINEAIDEKFKEQNIIPLIEAKVKSKVDDVTESVIETNIHQQIDPRLSSVNDALTAMQGGLNAMVVSNALTSDVMKMLVTIIRAENNDRQAFFWVHEMGIAGTNEYQTILEEAEATVESQERQADSPLNQWLIPWQQVGCDPDTNTLQECETFFMMHPDPVIQVALLQKIADETRFPRDSKLAFYRFLLPIMNDLKIIFKLCHILGDESGLRLNVLGEPTYKAWIDSELLTLLVTNFPATNGTNAFSPSLTVERAATLQSLTNCVYAAKYYQLGLQSAPTNADLLNGYAWLLATCTDDSVRNGTNAVRLAKQACELSGWKTWYNVGTLAAACAEAGDFDDATNYESMAIGMAGIDNSSKQMEKRRLELFRAHRPSHEDPPQNALGNIRFQ